MGVVYLCLHLEKNIPIALKMPNRKYLANPETRKTFEREILTWISLEKHPNIVRCLHIDQIEKNIYIVLEWIVSGNDFRVDLRNFLRHGPINIKASIEFAVDICQGLSHANQKIPGIVHADIKPENILIAQNRYAKITDWGLSRVFKNIEYNFASKPVEELLHNSLSQNNITGTPPYMAPELWLGEDVDFRTDIYALGCVIYEMINGEPPFKSNTLSGLIDKHLKEQAPRIGLSGGGQLLEKLITKCLEKKQRERFSSISELQTELIYIYEKLFGKYTRGFNSINEFNAIDFANRGNAYGILKYYDEALAELKKAIELAPNLAEAHFGVGMVLQDQIGWLKRHPNSKKPLYDHLKEALPYFERANALGLPQAKKWLELTKERFKSLEELSKEIEKRRLSGNQ
jgi:serine/threonine protein kinase